MDSVLLASWGRNFGWSKSPTHTQESMGVQLEAPEPQAPLAWKRAVSLVRGVRRELLSNCGWTRRVRKGREGSYMYQMPIGYIGTYNGTYNAYKVPPPGTFTNNPPGHDCLRVTGTQRCHSLAKGTQLADDRTWIQTYICLQSCALMKRGLLVGVGQRKIS